MSNLIVTASFTINKGDDPSTGLTLADIDLLLTQIDRDTGARTIIWDGTQNPTFEVDNVGAYGRIYATADMDTYNYIAGATYTGGATLDNNYVSGGIGLIEEVRADVIADATLKRGVSNVEDTADTTSLTTVILAMLESGIVGTTWTIRKTDGTNFVVKTATVDATAEPITGVT